MKEAVQENSPCGGEKPGEGKEHCPEYLVIEPERTEAEYPIPAAFAAYTDYLQIRLGQERFL